MSSDSIDSRDRLNQKVAIFVPSRYKSGQPVSSSEQANQVRVVAGALADIFGGASAEELVTRAKPLVGTFRHEMGHGLPLVDETVIRVWAAVSENHLALEEKRKIVLREACRLRDSLLQECVLVEWGQEVLFTPSAHQPESAVTFDSLERNSKEEFALMAWYRVSRPEDLAGVLSLAGWKFGSTVELSGEHNCKKIAWISGKTSRTAWAWIGTHAPRRGVLNKLAVGDLLVMSAPDSKLRVWLRTPQGVAGPREVPMATDSRPAARMAIEFVIALLDGRDLHPLTHFLDSEGATGRFYSETRDLISSIAKELRKYSSALAPSAVAQRIVGRLLFLRFVEAKGWLPKEFLRNGWCARQGSYHRGFLQDVFRTLNTAPSERADPAESVPYLNGGLFALRNEDEQFEIADVFFDPSRRGSVLEVLYRYHFTLDETASQDQSVSVDPAMLGRVLESLTTGETRKKKGVHYTPAPVARALAIGGIFPQISRRLKQCGTTGVDAETLYEFCSGRSHAVTDEVAEKIQSELRQIRIVDPAVGSGALLVACLEVMLELDRACRLVQGGDLRKGSKDWAEAARHFVRECLFGVDISPEAIEVAQLRLWLFLAVGEQKPTALPDLGYNLRVGNALAYDLAEERLVQEFLRNNVSTRALEFDEVDRSLNSMRDAIRCFQDPGPKSPKERSRAFSELEAAERSLRIALGAKSGDVSEAPPFAWSFHFPEVFRGPNNGFDLVIANPPYVRSSRIPAAERKGLKARYRSMRNRNVDLYYAFIERCLRSPAPAASPRMRDKLRLGELHGLAGRAGGVAFIMPSFAQTQSAENLRALLAEGGHVERWVDFVEQQVFPTATNYVALLFATCERRSRKTFQVQLITPDAFARMQAGQSWIETVPSRTVQYKSDGWNIRHESLPSSRFTRLLSEFASVTAGIQTSLDDVFLVSECGPGSSDGAVLVKNAIGQFEIEREFLFPCAKGSRDLQGDAFVGRCCVLWPYRVDGVPMEQAEIESQFPRAWAYLLAKRHVLEARENGKLKLSRWWCFRRPQGVKAAREPKLLVPSLMFSPTAFLDRSGSVICTASGKGGGGGWVIQPAADAQVDLAQLARYFTSSEFGAWIRANAEPKKGGWWGVDAKTLKRCPVNLDSL